MTEKKKDEAAPAPHVPKVEQPDPRSPQYQQEAREEIAKKKLDP
jgi:hypothetical protein